MTTKANQKSFSQVFALVLLAGAVAATACTRSKVTVPLSEPQGDRFKGAYTVPTLSEVTSRIEAIFKGQVKASQGGTVFNQAVTNSYGNLPSTRDVAMMTEANHSAQAVMAYGGCVSGVTNAGVMSSLFGVNIGASIASQEPKVLEFAGKVAETSLGMPLSLPQLEGIRTLQAEQLAELKAINPTPTTQQILIAMCTTSALLGNAAP